jgi:hypothetical protein
VPVIAPIAVSGIVSGEKHQDPATTLFSDIDIAARIHRHANRIVELAGIRTEDTPLRHIRPGGVKHLNPVITGISDINIA